MTAKPASRILYLTIGDASNPGTRLRPMAYLPYLRRRGHEVTLLSPVGAGLSSRWTRRALRPADLLRDLGVSGRFDLVVVYRKTYPRGTARWLRRRARRLIYEFDDAVYLPAPSEAGSARSEARYRRNFQETIAAADLVLAGNRQLAAAAVERPVAVVPTGVDLQTFRATASPPRADRCVFGWIGTAENLPQWERLVPVFHRVAASRPQVRFKVVSNRAPDSGGLPFEFERFTIERQAACLEGMDVGLMPLEDTPWNRGKCGVKALQCMALGLPVVVSPVGMNSEVIEPHVSGLLATTESEWEAALGRLAGSPELRARMGGAARREVERHYALDVIAARVVELLERLL